MKIWDIVRVRAPQQGMFFGDKVTIVDFECTTAHTSRQSWEEQKVIVKTSKDLQRSVAPASILSEDDFCILMIEKLDDAKRKIGTARYNYKSPLNIKED